MPPGTSDEKYLEFFQNYLVVSVVSHHPGAGAVPLPVEGEGEDAGLVRRGSTVFKEI